MLTNKLIFVLLILLIMVSCNDESITNPLISDGEKLVKAQVDLQNGFANNIVTIGFNNEIVFNAMLSPFSPLSGPEAKFMTYLPIGINNLIVTKRDLETFSIIKADSTSISIENKEKYFIGVHFFDSLTCIIQDSAFLYL